MSWIPVAFGVAAAIIDLRTREIPDSLSIGAGFLGLGSAAVGLTGTSSLTSLTACVIALLVSLLFAWRGGFGGGDVKLVAGLATWLPISGTVAMLFWTAVFGMAFSIVAAVRGKRNLAYAPAIATGFGMAAFAPGSLPAIIEWIRYVVGTS